MYIDYISSNNERECKNTTKMINSEKEVSVSSGKWYKESWFKLHYSIKTWVILSGVITKRTVK